MNNPKRHNLIISLFDRSYSSARLSINVQVKTHSNIYINTLNHSNKFIFINSFRIKFDLNNHIIIYIRKKCLLKKILVNKQ